MACVYRETPADFQLWTKGLETARGSTEMSLENKSMKKTSGKQAENLCPHGEVFSPDNCNSCQCNPANGATSCTRMSCEYRERPAPEEKSLKKTSLKQDANLCPQGVTYALECNTCWCNPENGATMCTLRGCNNYVEITADFGSTKRLETALEQPGLKIAPV